MGRDSYSVFDQPESVEPLAGIPSYAVNALNIVVRPLPMMAHEFFRYLIPGIIFFLPLCGVAGGMYLFHGDALFVERLKSAGALIGVVAVPVGWFIYQAWRTVWHLYRGGYEPRDFLERIRHAVRVYRQESLSRTLVDFTPVLGKKVGMRWFTAEEFECVFDPFRQIVCKVGFNSQSEREKRARGRKWHLHFVEPVSDLMLFANQSYDYARSVASARYGISVSIFALICGSIVSLATSLWHCYPASQTARILSLSLVLLLSIALTRLVWKRRKMATQEHFARVQLITHINCTDRRVGEKPISSLLDSELLAKLKDVSAFGHHDTGNRLAAFDMDGTLIRHDIGDAVLAMLIYQGLIRSEAWKTYQQLLKNSRPEGYKFAVTAMSGLSVDDVYQATRLALKPGLKEIPVPVGEPVKRPTVSLKMQALVIWLHRQGFDIYVVTATNRWSATIVASDFFGISEKHVFGVEVKKDKRGRLTDQILLPTPIGEGKAEIWKKHMESRRPLLAAGDSTWDLPLLGLVGQSGMALWLGHSDQKPPGTNVIVTTLD